MDGTTVEPDSEIKLVRVSGGLAWGMGSWAGGWGGTSRPLLPRPSAFPLLFNAKLGFRAAVRVNSRVWDFHVRF